MLGEEGGIKSDNDSHVSTTEVGKSGRGTNVKLSFAHKRFKILVRHLREDGKRTVYASL